MIIIGNEDIEIPNPFPFPTHYRSDIEAGLHLKTMDSVVQAKFLTRIAGVMYMYKRNPDVDDYRSVATQVVNRSLPLPVVTTGRHGKSMYCEYIYIPIIIAGPYREDSEKQNEGKKEAEKNRNTDTNKDRAHQCI